MKEFTYTQDNPGGGEFKGVLRVIGSIIYLKFNNSQDPRAQQIITNLYEKGADVERGKAWIRINMFKDKELCKIEGEEFDVTETPEEEIEKILYIFFIRKFKEANFKIK